MRMRTFVSSIAVGMAPLLGSAQSTIAQSTIAQSTIAKPTIPESTINSAILNPQSSMRWRALFDGASLDAWRGYKSPSVPAGWRIADGALTKDGHAGDLITKDQF